MAWYFNFCAPFLTNDYIINFHRFLQAACLLGFLVIYIFIHFYYKMCGPDPKKVQKQDQSNNNKEKSDKDSQKQKGSAEEYHNNDKSVSIAGGYGGDQNTSYITFKTVKKAKTQIDEQKIIPQKQVIQKLTIAEIESYFPIVYGHFSIGSALSIMYSPYAQQTIATMVYILFSFFLLLANSKRKIKTTRVIWGFMCFLVCFLMMSGLLEVGQANYNKLESQCFSVGYQALY